MSGNYSIPVSVPIDQTSGGAGTIDIAAAPGAGKRNVLLGYQITSDANGTVTFLDDNSSPVSLTGVMQIAQRGDLTYPADRIPIGACTVNKKLQMTSATGKITGFAVYVVETI